MTDSSSAYGVPVAIFLFNRPDLAARTLKAVASLRPSRIFLICDGARLHVPGELQKVNQCKDLVHLIDWPCVVETNFAETNLGCRDRIVSGLDWVFSRVENAIVLEDDCLPTGAFFDFVSQMMKRYEADRAVYAVSGSCFVSDALPVGHVRSPYSLMWGWATWANRWRQYRKEPESYIRVVVRSWWRRPIEMMYWLAVFRNISAGRLTSAWDYQWMLSIWREGGCAIRPTLNLVENIGFREDATHTKSSERFGSALSARDLNVRQGDYPLLDVEIERRISEADRRLWAMINLRTVALLWLPMLKRLKRH